MRAVLMAFFDVSAYSDAMLTDKKLRHQLQVSRRSIKFLPSVTLASVLSTAANDSAQLHTLVKYLCCQALSHVMQRICNAHNS